MEKELADKIIHAMNNSLPESVSITWRHIHIPDVRKTFISHRNYLNNANVESRVYESYLEECYFLLKLIKLRNVHLETK
jgi:hypothetical protein